MVAIDTDEQFFLSFRVTNLLTQGLFAASFGLMGSFVSMMLLFMGYVGEDVTVLLLVQALGFPLVIVPIVAFGLGKPHQEWSLGQLWSVTPGWLLVGLAVALGTSLCGHVALMVVQNMAHRELAIDHFVPILSAYLYGLVWAFSFVLHAYCIQQNLNLEVEA
jgi:hypothetical protein